jgi:hypothetical protein
VLLSAGLLGGPALEAVTFDGHGDLVASWRMVAYSGWRVGPTNVQLSSTTRRVVGNALDTIAGSTRTGVSGAKSGYSAMMSPEICRTVWVLTGVWKCSTALSGSRSVLAHGSAVAAVFMLGSFRLVTGSVCRSAQVQVNR